MLEVYNDDVKGNSWNDQLSMKKNELPVFPIEALPASLADYAVSVSQFTQTPIDMAAVASLATASACMRNLYKVEVNADWHEPTNIYSAIVAGTSERKSAVVSFIKSPVETYVDEYNEKHKFDFEMSRVKRQLLENKKKTLISRITRRGELAADRLIEELNSVNKELANFKETKPLKAYVDDITPKKLIMTLAENDGAMSIISSNEEILDVVYKAFVNSGNNMPKNKNSYKSVHPDKACLSILLAVPPLAVEELMSNDDFHRRGLTARFLYTFPKSNVGTRTFDQVRISEDSYKAYEMLIYNLLSENRNGNAELITLTSEARDVFSDYYNWTEKLHAREQSTMYGNWLGNLAGNTLRIAGILARCFVIKNDGDDKLADASQPIIIDKNIMENAISIGRYFMFHAIKTYDTGHCTVLKAEQGKTAKE